ncbi:hypothetical protein KY289_007860 [Solanum tuberosum]|nr:hypothetical protein KY289_007860 [Solanum tuberosum]
MAIPKIDQNDSLYIEPLDASGPVSMRIALLGKRKFVFVTGACTRGLYKEELHEQWESCNAIVLSWLMNTISEDLLSGIVYATTAFSVWEDLKERFDKMNRMRIYQLHSGLNDSYDQARRQILSKRIDKPESIVLNVNKNQGREYHKGKRCEFCHYTGQPKENYCKLIGYPEDWKQRRKSGSGNGTSSRSGYCNTRNASNSTNGGGYGRQSSTNNMNLRNAGNSGDYGGQHLANNASHNHYDYSQFH